MIIESSTIRPPKIELVGCIDTIKYPAFTEIKYDGEFQYIHYDEVCTMSQFIHHPVDILSVNTYGKVRMDFPALTVIGKILHKAKVSQCVLMGELIWGYGTACTFYNLHKQDNSLNLKVFDVCAINKKSLINTPLLERKEILVDLGFPQTAKLITSRAEADHWFKLDTDRGFEGSVVKPLESTLLSPKVNWAKMKFKDQNDYKIVKIDKDLERLEIEITWMRGVRTVGVRTVGVKCLNKYKKYLKVGDIVTIEHQGRLSQGGLRHPVLIPKKEWK